MTSVSSVIGAFQKLGVRAVVDAEATTDEYLVLMLTHSWLGNASWSIRLSQQKSVCKIVREAVLEMVSAWVDETLTPLGSQAQKEPRFSAPLVAAFAKLGVRVEDTDQEGIVYRLVHPIFGDRFIDFKPDWKPNFPQLAADEFGWMAQSWAERQKELP